MRREFELPAGYFGALRLFAAKDGRSETDVLRQALDEYFGKFGIRPAELVREPAWPPPTNASRERLAEALAKIPPMPAPEFTPEELEEIERDITETVKEVRAELYGRRNAANS